MALVDGLILTHDSIAEGIHYLPEDPPESVGWKLVAVNLSDLAAKGAEPLAALLSLTLSGDTQWEDRFLDGVAAACESYGLPLVGGDTIALPEGAPRVLGLTALGRAGASVPLRTGAKAGDRLWLIGVVGDAAVGLTQLIEDRNAIGPLVDVYRRPVPLLAAGRALAPYAHAMMDVSDGLLLDASRLAVASGLGAEIDLNEVPLSSAFVAERGANRKARLFAATGGDDYALLAALPPKAEPELSFPLPSGSRFACIGSLAADGPPLRLVSGGLPIKLPERLGHEHCGLPASPMDDRR